MATQQTIVNWAKDQIYKWIDMDGAYGAQCVDLIMAYVKNFANFRVSGNAIDYLTNTLPNGWRRYRKGEATIAPGDIAIWHWGSWDKYGLTSESLSMYVVILLLLLSKMLMVLQSVVELLKLWRVTILILSVLSVRLMITVKVGQEYPNKEDL